ncbi:MAG: hypothetical protein AMJ94_02890 [Deltaproteobacteria bacterium SM23_61]|nr:MAG: hypothetical protein AMJ94_02890 [Deltaproteobacteria bacterium SM23_61]
MAFEKHIPFYRNGNGEGSMILEGIRVLDISNLLASPYWAMILGERAGEHTVEILTEEGFSAAKIENLKGQGIV